MGDDRIRDSLRDSARDSLRGLRSLRVRSVLVVIAVVLLPLVFVVFARWNEALYDLRDEIEKLVLLMLPVGLFLGFWLGWRTVRPIEQLRHQVLAKAAGAGGDIILPRSDELGDLAVAFNALLHALDERRAQNEAFVADLVHELKNPVAAIRVCADSLESGAADAARAERLARVLKDSSARLDTLVTQFLEIARAEAGLPNEERSRVDVARLAAGIVGSMRARDEHAGVAFAIEAPGRAEIVGVEHRIDSALRNLLENAASFAAPGGRVHVRAARFADRVEIVVSDSGPGIDAADLPRVFDRFFTTRGRTRGTGLGLALVRAVVIAHGGTIAAESRLGEGATFRVLLPSA